MKSTCLLFLLPVGLWAQPPTPPRPRSLVAAAPYLPPAPQVRVLDPLPATLPVPPLPPPPTTLPDELLVPAANLPSLALLRKAHQALSTGDYSSARLQFEAFLKKHPDDLSARTIYADCLASLGELATAEPIYRDLLLQHPNHFQALNNLAWLYASASAPHLHQPRTALALARRALLLQPESHHVWSTLSLVQFQLRSYEEALASAQTALLLAQRGGAGPRIEVGYLLQLDRCRAALAATSLIE